MLGASEEKRRLQELRATLGEAITTGRPIAMGGARHSLGGQSLPRFGIAADVRRGADRAGQRQQDLPRQRRRALARRDPRARSARLLAGGDAVEQ